MNKMEKNQNKTMNKGKVLSTIRKFVKSRGTVIALCFALLLTLSACGGGDSDYVETEADKNYDMTEDALDMETLTETILPETQDAGQEYLDNTLFIGDSNTVRSMMYGHTTWDNVVAAVSMGVQHITKLEMTYFKGYDKAVTVPEAVKLIQPQRIVITYGSNNVFMDVDTYIKEYKTGLQAIEKAYPYAEIIINSIPPIDRERENLNITMQAIDKLNKALSEMAKEEGYKFLNSSEVLKDEETGFAKKDYTIGDGVHLSKLGMDELFRYIRTHSYITKDTRPKPLKKVPEREETPTGIISEDPLAVRGTRIKILFTSSDSSLGWVDGEVEQKIKRTITSKPVTAVANYDNGGIFTGWSCSYGGISDVNAEGITYKVPKVDENVTEIVITANFSRTNVEISKGSVTLKTGESTELSAWTTGGFKGNGGISWSSNNNEVATVSGGKVKAVKEGVATITASAVGGKFTASCVVTVTAGDKPSPSPTATPTASPSAGPTATPTATPTPAPEDKPTIAPEPTTEPVVTTQPTAEPTTEPTAQPTTAPTQEPTPVPTAEPTAVPTAEPTAVPEPTTPPDTTTDDTQLQNDEITE